MCINEFSLQDEGQESGPVFIPSESFTKLPRMQTQSEPSYTDKARPSWDNRSAHVDDRSQLGTYLSARNILFFFFHHSLH